MESRNHKDHNGKKIYTQAYSRTWILNINRTFEDGHKCMAMKLV